jgi:hypothetical protein
MEASTQRTVQHLWLPLLVVFVLCAGLVSPVSWAESQQQVIELESESESESSDDDPLNTGLLPGLAVTKFLSLSSILAETLSLTGSDAYPSIALHGPPAPEYSV